MANGLLGSGVLVHSPCINYGKGFHTPNSVLGLTFRNMLPLQHITVPKCKLFASAWGGGGALYIWLCMGAVILTQERVMHRVQWEQSRALTEEKWLTQIWWRVLWTWKRGRKGMEVSKSGLLFSKFLYNFENVAVFEKLPSRCVFSSKFGKQGYFWALCLKVNSFETLPLERLG